MAGRKYRPFIAVNLETGEKKEWSSTYAFAKAMQTGHENVRGALNRRGVILGKYRLYDTPEEIRKRIAELERQLEEVESI